MAEKYYKDRWRLWEEVEDKIILGCRGCKRKLVSSWLELAIIKPKCKCGYEPVKRFSNKGIRYRADRGKYVVTVREGGKRRQLGSYTTAEEARKVRDKYYKGE